MKKFIISEQVLQLLMEQLEVLPPMTKATIVSIVKGDIKEYQNSELKKKEE